MQQPKMMVLGLIGIGLRYGFEMEAFIEDTEMRRWAQLGMSTIYKTLKDLDSEGSITGNLESGGKGPSRKAYSLTEQGRDRLRSFIADALRSDTSVYSERIAGLVFAPLLHRGEGQRLIRQSITGLKSADATLAASLREKSGDFIAEAVIQYYRDVYAAERSAMEKVLRGLRQSKRLRSNRFEPGRNRSKSDKTL